jgi:hypothetical protein
VEEEEILTGDWGLIRQDQSHGSRTDLSVAVDACSHQYHNANPGVSASWDEAKVGNENIVLDAIDSIIPSKYHIGLYYLHFFLVVD